MAFTDVQRAAIRYYLGWPASGFQLDTRLESALRAVESKPEHVAQITNSITSSPPGLLAMLADIDAKLLAAHGRFKASAVGSITLNPGEMGMLRSEGRRMVGRLAALIGRDIIRSDAFGAGGPVSNYVGK